MSEAKPKGQVRQFSTFMLVGGFAALVNWSSRIALSAAGLPLTLAIVLAYVLGMTTAYVLSKRFVFEKSGRSVRDEAVRFTIVNVFALAQVWAVTIVLQRWGLPAINWNWHPEEIAHAVGVASPVITSYFGHQYFTFEQSDAKRKLAAEATETKTPQ